MSGIDSYYVFNSGACWLDLWERERGEERSAPYFSNHLRQREPCMLLQNLYHDRALLFYDRYNLWALPI